MTAPLRIVDLMRRMPDLRRLDARLSDPDWHPTAEEVAEARKALANDRADRQSELELRAA